MTLVSTCLVDAEKNAAPAWCTYKVQTEVGHTEGQLHVSKGFDSDVLTVILIDSQCWEGAAALSSHIHAPSLKLQVVRTL